MFPRIITFIQIALIIACPMGCASGFCAEDCCDSVRSEMNASDSECVRRDCCEAVEVIDKCCGDVRSNINPADCRDLPPEFCSLATGPEHTGAEHSGPIDSCPSKCLRCICGGAVFERPIEINQIFGADLDSLFGPMIGVMPLLRDAKCFDKSRGRHDPHCNVGRYLCILQHSFLI